LASFGTLLAKMYLHQYDYIFAIGTLFAMLDAYNNGASE
jgi:sodium-dependent phosphate transporter